MLTLLTILLFIALMVMVVIYVAGVGAFRDFYWRRVAKYYAGIAKAADAALDVPARDAALKKQMNAESKLSRFELAPSQD